MYMERVGVIGYGNMGSALVRGLTARKIPVTVLEKHTGRAASVQSETDAVICKNVKELLASADTVVLAVKPQDFAALLQDMKGICRGHRFISIAAGIPIHRIAETLATDEVVRFMPNLAAAVGKSAVGVAFSAGTSPAFRKDALTVAGAVGSPFELPERLIPAFTGLSGSGIAYVFAFIHALALGGVRTGIDYATSLSIGLETLEGAVDLLRQGNGNPAEMLSRVVSPAGTTIAGVNALEHGGFTGSVMDAVFEAAERAENMEKN